LLAKTNLPVSLTVLTPEIGKQLGVTDRESSNAFGKLRFLVPYLCGFKGGAIFLDGADMMLRSSLAELWSAREAWYGLQVVKHDYQTKSPKKYVGTDMESPNKDYPAKNWSSVMLWSCDFKPHLRLTPEFIASKPNSYLHRFEWMDHDRIGELPKEWNHLVGEQQFSQEAKLAHFTLGIPGFEHYRHADYAEEWTTNLKAAAKGLQYLGR
jgi:hypothetical protein